MFNFAARNNKKQQIFRAMKAGFIQRNVLILLLGFVSFTAMSQIRFGLKAGVNINSLHFNKNIGQDIFSSENRAGFAGGIMMEFNLPIVGLGLDASAMYSHRSDDLGYYTENSTLKRDYFTFPINLKYKLSLPVLGNVVKPFATTGPEFSFLINDNFKKFNLSTTFDGKKMSTAWNVGFGIEIMNKVQLHANYSIGLTNALEAVGITSDQYDNETFQTRGKDKYWTVTAAYLF